jgi:hypothetical protein
MPACRSAKLETPLWFTRRLAVFAEPDLVTKRPVVPILRGACYFRRIEFVGLARLKPNPAGVRLRVFSGFRSDRPCNIEEQR